MKKYAVLFYFLIICLYPVIVSGQNSSGDAAVQQPELQSETSGVTGEGSAPVTPAGQKAATDPSSADEYKALGDRYTKEKKSEAALEAYKTYMEMGGQNGAVALKVGTQAYAQSRYQDALKYLGIAQTAKIASPDLLFMLGDSYYNTGSFEKAILTFKDLMKLGPKVKNLPLAMTLTAKSYEALKEDDKALYWYDRYATANTRPGMEISHKRAALREKTKEAEAIKIYLQNTKLFPQDYRNFLRLGIIYSKKSATLSQSAVMLKKAVTLADTIASAWLETAQVYGKLKKNDEELDAYNRYLILDSENPAANARFGSILLRQGKTSEAIMYLEKAYAKTPDDSTIIISLATCYLKVKNNDKALKILVKGKERHPQNTELRTLLAAAYKKTGRTDQAITELKEVIEIRPDNKAQLQYAKLLRGQGRLDEAINAIEGIRAVDPENTDALFTLGQIYQEQKKYDQALEIYKEIMFIDGKNALALYGQAEVYLAQSKVLWAEKYYKSALESDPKLGLAAYGMAKIAKLRKNEPLYKQHLKNAYALSPDEPEIKKAYTK